MVWVRACVPVCGESTRACGCMCVCMQYLKNYAMCVYNVCTKCVCEYVCE